MGLKKHTLHWTRPAEDRLDRILTHIGFEDPETARKLFAKLMAALDQVVRFPGSAPALQDVGPTYRELVSVRPFRVIYRIEGSLIRVITVLRQEQDFDPRRFLDA
jgi:plasmid stabilization system protein ParE